MTKMALLAIRSSLRSGSHAAAILGRSTIDVRGLHPKIVRIDRDVAFSAASFAFAIADRMHFSMPVAPACSRNAESPAPD